ncbi:hypothetical protein L0663_21805 [Dyadobacter sp. CY107]|uniref:hypothetical protein n=1 Tax=Dyadobacter fanqingshengii TaxID=2906443 RepID=UPI001F3E39C9|nr:hypothetical protein [Dyadobacter fanqingshengii]MCF2506047.1 hypothetical protein [Dyadobacter fanqingshengii]
MKPFYFTCTQLLLDKQISNYYKMSGFPNEAWTVEDGALVAQRGVIEGSKVI